MLPDREASTLFPRTTLAEDGLCESSMAKGMEQDGEMPPYRNQQLDMESRKCKRQIHTSGECMLRNAGEQSELHQVRKTWDKATCAPFLKWPGGKRQLLNELACRMPQNFNRYFEPFVGGGALFFRVKPEYGYISDINPELINVYEVVQNHVEELIVNLRRHRNSEEYFYELRSADRTEKYMNWTNVERASRTFFLNKTCFNGLYRMNSSGHFNVPFGFYKKPRVFDEKNLFACSALLRTAEIALAPFEEVVKKARRETLSTSTHHMCR